jgi:hypothetical protein
MLTHKQGGAAVEDLEDWASKMVRSIDPATEASIYYDGDSGTYVIRLARGSRVLLFRLSEAQVRTPGREKECADTLKRKVRDL